jgi:hypothetical protein
MIHRAIPAAVALTAVLSISCASPPPIAGEIREIADGHEGRSDRNVRQPSESTSCQAWMDARSRKW